MKHLLSFLFTGILLTAILMPANANGKNDHELVIGVTSIPPYVILENHQVSGAMIALWEAIADSMKVSFRYEKFDTYPHLIEALNRGSIDLSLVPRTITRERLSNSKLTVPILDTRVGAMMKKTDSFPFFIVLKSMMNLKSLKILCVTLLIILIFSTFIWLLERKKNHEMFHQGVSGIFDGMWWAIVTMTTVGYGDKVPRTRMGRVLTVFWMFYAIGLLFLLTSEFASELTVTKLQPEIISVRSLEHMKTSTLINTGYAEMLKANGINYLPVTTVFEGLELLKEGKIEVFLLDKNILNYCVENTEIGNDLMVLETGLNSQFLCFVIPEKEAGLLNQINPALLEVISTVRWKEVLLNYNIPQ